jgi:uncharacterized protein YecE (DUF72 family)
MLRVMSATVRIGTCSFADEALIHSFYPRGLPAKERLAHYASQFSTVEIDSTFYRMPSESTVANWAQRTPEGFVIHIKAFGVMTRHPVPAARLPPELRSELPLDSRGRVDRPSRAARGVVFAQFLEALEPLRASGKLGGILFQLPPYVVAKPSSYDYLEWARDQLGGDAMLVEFRHRSWFEAERQPELLRFLEAHEMSYVTVDAPRLEAANVPKTVVAATSPLSYVRFHGRNAATWNRRGGGAAERFDYMYPEGELAEWVEPIRELASISDSTYALFNNNNAVDGVAQAPAGAAILRRLLAAGEVPVS